MCAAVSQNGRLPLHDAAANNASEAVVKAQLAAYPEGAKKIDEDENLPLHVAVRYNASKAVVKALCTSLSLRRRKRPAAKGGGGARRGRR